MMTRKMAKMEFGGIPKAKPVARGGISALFKRSRALIGGGSIMPRKLAKSLTASVIVLQEHHEQSRPPISEIPPAG
jgi:hypothetical protein